MSASMNCFRRARDERGATLTGYTLLMAGLVVVSVGAIRLVNESSDAVLSDTGSSIGNPRVSVEAVKAAPAPAAPPWAVSDTGYCTPGFDGCPLGTTLAVDPAAYQPPNMSGDIQWGGTAESIDFANLADDAGAFVMLESVVQLNGEWQPPQSDSDTNPAPVLVQPGENVCTYVVHAAPLTGTGDFNFDIQFQGEVLGTAYNSDFDVDSVFTASGATYPAANYIEASDNFDISGGSLTANGLQNNLNATDEIRVFVRC
jgi:Flp pilus assembly pilin Flp